MSLKPSERHGGINRPRREFNEHERNKQRREKEKKDFYRRNPHRKWGDR